MKKILILFMFLLIGCSNDRLEKIEVDRNHYPLSFDSTPIGISETGLYYIKNEILYYKDNNEETVPLGSMNYVNGEKSDLLSKSNSNVREDRFGGRDLICYGDRIYMEYQTWNHDMSTTYQLASVNLKGEDFKTHIIFDYFPQEIKINNGKIYVSYFNLETNENYIETYDRNFKLISTDYFDTDIMGFYIEDDQIIVPDDFVIYENDNVKISYAIENIRSDEFRKSTGKIQIDDKEYTFENKYVLFVNDKYFYTSSCTSPQTYERYHLNGELDKSIVIGEQIESEGTINHLFNMDFSYMLKLRNENIVYGYSRNEGYPRIFEVNFEKGTCHYVDE